MPTQRAASIPSGLEQQQWTGLRGLEKVQCLFAEGWARACKGPRSRAQKKSHTGPPRSPPKLPGCPSESREELSHSKRRGSCHARGIFGGGEVAFWEGWLSH